MRQIRSDLWETSTDSPFPGLTTHAYLWTPRHGGNVLFYSVATQSEFIQMAELGGIAHHYLSHRDEAGPMLARIADVFGARLHAPAAEHAEIAKHSAVHELVATRHTDANGVEVIPTPGHSPGSTSYLVRGAEGGRYLFTGDTVLLGDDGWFAGYLPGISEAAPLRSSLQVLATVQPDWVISSAFIGASGVHPMTEQAWSGCLEEAIAALDSATEGRVDPAYLETR